MSASREKCGDALTIDQEKTLATMYGTAFVVRSRTAAKTEQPVLEIQKRGQVSRAIVTEEANKEPRIPGSAVTPPWQPPPFLVRAISVHPVE